jgi:wyosine [tRNA(Phe)-imidazoG37] synthetase (radical SAM superfamily)
MVMARRSLVYGPVPSRRFGLSLGVDLVPFKTCCYDCVYCELGRTTRLTVRREDFHPLDRVLSNLREALERGPRPEVITLAGSGEPTLYRSLGRLVREIHRLSDLPVVLLTNGGLLYHDDVARDVLEVDVLAPSLDAGRRETFQRINRPHPEIGFGCMLRGLGEVADRFRGELRVEVVLVRGENDRETEWWALADALTKVRHTRVDVSTVVRPSLSGPARPCHRVTLEAASRALGPAGRVVSPGPSRAWTRRSEAGEAAEKAERVRALLAIRPSTPSELAAGLDLHPNEVAKLLGLLLREGEIEERVQGERSYLITTERGRSKVQRREEREARGKGALDRGDL